MKTGGELLAATMAMMEAIETVYTGRHTKSKKKLNRSALKKRKKKNRNQRKARSIR